MGLVSFYNDRCILFVSFRFDFVHFSVNMNFFSSVHFSVLFVFIYRYGFYLLPSRVSFKFFMFPNAWLSHKDPLQSVSSSFYYVYGIIGCISRQRMRVCVYVYGVCLLRRVFLFTLFSCYSPHQDHRGYVCLCANRQLKIKTKKINNNKMKNEMERKRESQKKTHT